MENTGTRLLDSRYDAIIENATASDSGTKSCRLTPTMKNDGTNTARMQNIESRRAIAVRLHASTTARARETPGQHLRVNVLDLHRRLIHQHAHRQRQPAQRHDVDGLPGGPQQDHRAQQARTEYS